jgi:acyl-CoA synthetase (AMP-forming)/AMP-acid ligase II
VRTRCGPDGAITTAADLARLDGGRLFNAGRSKEPIIRSWFNVYPAEVEAVLNGNSDCGK